MRGRYMMATKAIHMLGDISRVKPDLCAVFSEDDENYIGNWVTGLGFIEVKFPKKTTHPLTAQEVEYYHGRHLVMGRTRIGPLEVKGSPGYEEET